jgi:TonB family protein
MLIGANYEPALLLLLMWAARTTVLLILAFTATLVLRGHSAALRHQIWAVAIIASLLLPLATVALPSWHIWSLEAGRVNSHQPPSPAITISAGDITAAAIPTQYSPADFSGVFLAIASLGTAFVLFRLTVGLLRLARTSAYARVAPQKWVSELNALRAAFGIGRCVGLLESANQTTMPMTWGIFGPRIVLPFGASEWTEDRRRIVLSHELAHISRGDWLFQIAAEILRACFWFNPLAWLAANRLRQESERACDDTVLNSGIAPSEYANELLALTQSLNTSSRRFSLALAIARPSNLERRFAAMLNPTTNRDPLQRTASLVAILLGAILLPALATVHLWAEAPPQSAPAATQPFVAQTIVANPSFAIATTSPAVHAQTTQARTAAAAARDLPGGSGQAVHLTANFGSKSAAASAATPAQQSASGNVASITGLVEDPTGAMVPRAVVDLTFESNPLVPSGEILTGQVGEFTFPSLVPGNYTLMIRQPGFQVYLAQHITLAAGQHLDLRQIRLRVGTITQVQTVHPNETTVSTAPADCSAPPVAPTPAPTPAPVVPPDPNVPKAPTRIRIGGNVEAAALVCRVEPVYPAAARAAGIEGTVTMRAVIAKNGTVMSLEVTNADKVDSSLMRAAIDSVSAWRYKPLLLNGEPVEVETEISVVFSLSN